MKSRWVVAAAMILAVGLAVAVAATETASTAPAGDPYLKDTAISTSAPADRVPCTHYNETCAGKQHGDACGPTGSICLCRVYDTYECVGRR